MTTFQDDDVPLTRPLEVGTQLEPLADTALGLVGKGLPDLLHLDPPRAVVAHPEQAVDEQLERGMTTTTSSSITTTTTTSKKLTEDVIESQK